MWDRAELLPATAMFGAVLAVRGRHWTGALALCAAGMLAKESGVVIGVVLLLYCWLDSEVGRPPAWFGVGLAMITAGYLALWRAVGGVAVADVAAPFIGATAGQRLTLALPAVWRAATLLVWPSDLSADYDCIIIQPQSGQAALITHELESFAYIARELNQPQRAARLLGAAETLQEQLGTSAIGVMRLQDEYQETVAWLKTQLAESVLAFCWSEGSAMARDEAISYALAEQGQPPGC